MGDDSITIISGHNDVSPVYLTGSIMITGDLFTIEHILYNSESLNNNGLDLLKSIHIHNKYGSSANIYYHLRGNKISRSDWI